MANPREVLLGEVQFGIEVEAFLNSSLGKYLVQKAETERDAALEKLKVADPDNAKEIRRLQNEVWRAESMQTWLAEAIQTGWNAETTIAQQDSPD